MLSLALALIPAAGALQEPVEAAAPPVQVPADDPEELFQQVIAAQLLRSRPVPVQGFLLGLNLRERGETAREVDLLVRYRAEDGGLIRLGVHDTEHGTRVEKGFDGERYWLLDDKGELIDLSAREYAQDRESIDLALDLCEELLLVFDLQRLRERASDLVIVPGEAGGPALGGRLRRKGEVWLFQLHLDEAGLEPKILDLVPPTEGQNGQAQEALPRQRFVFRYPRYFEERRLPQVVHEFHGDERKLPVRMLEIHRLEWRQPPAASALRVESGAPRREQGGR